MAIKGKNIDRSYRLPGVFASAALFLSDFRNGGSAQEGDQYFDTTLNLLRTHDGSGFSPAGQNSLSPGGLDAVMQIGAKVETDNAFEIEISAATSPLATLDADGTTNADILDISSEGGSGDLISLANSGTGKDINGTSGLWSVSKAGVFVIAGMSMIDNKALTLGNSSDAVLQWDSARLALTAVADSVFRIGAAGFSYDVEFIGNTAVTNLMKWDLDGGADSVGALVFDNADLDLGDGDLLRLGDGTDLTITATSTTATMLLAAGSDLKISDTDDSSSILTLGVTGGTHGLDVQFNTISSGEDMIFDAAAKTFTLDNVDIIMGDNDTIGFGDSSAEGTIGSDGTDIVCTGDFNFGVNATGVDVTFYGDTASSQMLWDQNGDTNGSLILTGATQTITGIDSGGNLLTLTGIDTTLDSDTMVITHSGSGDALSILCNEADGVALNCVGATSQVTSIVKIDGATGTWLGATGVGMLHLTNDGTPAHANATLLRIAQSGTNASGQRGICASLEDSSSSGGGTEYALYIASTNNEALHVDAGIVKIDEHLLTAGVILNDTARTVTAAPGGTTGVIADGTGFVTVTSSDGNKVLTLPTPTPGTIVWVAANATGYELRSDTPGSVAINGGTGASAESAVSSGVSIRCVCMSATTWICTQFAANGTESKLDAAA